MSRRPGNTEASNFPGLFSLFTQERLVEKELDPPHVGTEAWVHALHTAGSMILRAEDGRSSYTRLNQAASSIISIAVSRTVSPGSGGEIFYPYRIEAIRA